MDRNLRNNCGVRRPLPPRAFSLVELIVVIAIVTILLAVLLPALSGARREGHRTKCAANLKSMGQAAMTYATTDARDMIVPQHPSAPYYENEGYWDYGGASGRPGGEWAESDDPWHNFGASTRPLNKEIYPYIVGSSDDFSVFNCPSDQGWVDAPALIGGSPELMSGITVFAETGTSYVANVIRTNTEWDKWYSFGPYMRPSNRIPSTSETILFADSVSWQALSNSVPHSPLGEPQLIEGWHGRPGRFEGVMCDGSGRTLRMRPDEFHATNPADELMVRGDNFRFDCRPEPLIEE